MPMLRRISLVLSAAALTAAGCQQQVVNHTYGSMEPDVHAKWEQLDKDRLAGEDHARNPVYEGPFWLAPFNLIGQGIDKGIVQPTSHFIDYLEGDTPGAAARKIVDQQSADHRREGTLRLSDFAFAREGKADQKLWGILGSNDDDYSVRAAGIRALNRSRDKSHTTLYIKSLSDENQMVRLEAAKALANVPDEQAITPLITHLQNDPNKDVRIACADALRNYKSIEVAHALAQVLADTDFGVAWQARQSLCLMTGRDYRYNERAWLDYLTESKNPFG